jgi:hypothetical protein
MKAKFDQDKANTLAVASGYLAGAPEALPSKEILRQQISELAKGDQVDYKGMIEKLDQLRDLKTGIVWHEETRDGTNVLIRDARNCEVPPVRSTESFEMQYLNAARAAIELVKLEVTDNAKADEAIKQINQQAKDFMENFHKDYGHIDQKQLLKLTNGNIDQLTKTLKQAGVAKAVKKLNYIKDFQSFNDKQANAVTISKVGEKGNIVIEADVALRGLSEKQEREYNNITANNFAPNWYHNLPEWQRKICKQYAPTIAKGEHTIPTQLGNIAGLRNAFEKITAVVNNGSEIEVINATKHTGTVASLSKDQETNLRTTNDNVSQAKEWVGEDATLHINTLNSNPPWLLRIFGASKKDAELMPLVESSTRVLGVRWSNAAFNLLRRLPWINNYDGFNTRLSEIAKNLPPDEKYDQVKKFLSSDTGLFNRIVERIFGNSDSRQKVEESIKDLNPPEREILLKAIKLKDDIKSGGSIGRIFDPQNVNLDITSGSTDLNNKIKITKENKTGPTWLNSVKNEENVDACASGKDRDGLNLHNITVQALSEKLAIPVAELDVQILAAGHTAHQAGGVRSGGGSNGCHGTKDETSHGIPSERAGGLQDIMADSANNNKIEKGKLKDGRKALKKMKDHKEKNDLHQPSQTPTTHVPGKSSSRRT